jgi:hypothetical protein
MIIICNNNNNIKYKVNMDMENKDYKNKMI